MPECFDKDTEKSLQLTAKDAIFAAENLFSMKIFSAFILAMSLCAAISAASAATSVDIVPRPASMTVADGYFTVPQRIDVSAESKQARPLAKEMVKALRMAGFDAAAKKSADGLAVTFTADAPEEGYRLTVSSRGIVVEASSATGAYYAAQTLAQLLAQSPDRRLPYCTIDDAPRMAYRGLMLDVVRNFIEPAEIKKFIDVASRLKINNLHLHLTDDNGWRLEIKKYPRLTEVGAWRVYRPELFPGRRNQRDPSEPTPVGGFYTQKEMRDIVRYAAERHVNVIPEIEMPAHAVAAIASYPDLACPVNDKFVGVFPGIGGKDAAIIMCAGNDDVYRFYEDVIEEVTDIFPSKLINIGGDEAQKRLWQQCPRCQECMAHEGLKDCEELQGYFMGRINSFLRTKGRTAMGWDEVTYGNPKEDIVVLGWQGDGSTASEYSRRTGRKFIMTPALVTYLIRYQGPQWFEPFTYFGNNTISGIYNYEPVKSDWTPQMERDMLGIQGSLWSEFCSSASDVQYLVFPRLLAVADLAWRPKGTSDIGSFFRAVDGFLPVLDSLGVNHASSMWNIQHTARPTGDGAVTVELTCERPDAEIRYSLSDSTFTDSHAYTAPLTVSGNTTLYASTFRDGANMGRTLVLPVRFNKATGRTVTAENCRNNLAPALTNGVRGSNRNSDFEWAGWWNADPQFTLDLGSTEPINKVQLGVLINSDICVAAPVGFYLYGSDDGKSFNCIARQSVSPEDVFAHPAKIVDIDFAIPADTRARYLKVKAVSPGAIPDGMAREGAQTWICFDEIEVD